MGKVIFTMSGKGGTGKTSVGAGVVSCLAILGCKTVFIDIDCGLRNADIILGVSEKAVIHLGDVLCGNATWEDAAVKHPEIPGLSVIAAPEHEYELDLHRLKEITDTLAGVFDYVWIDGPAGIGERLISIAGTSNLVILVVTPDVVSMRDAAYVAEQLDGIVPMQLIANRIRPRLIDADAALMVDDLMDGTGVPLLGVVPEDERVIAAANKGLPLVALSQDGAALAYRDIALRLSGDRVPLGSLKANGKAGRTFLSKLKNHAKNDV